MTRLTVVAADRRIIVDGEVLEFDFVIDPAIRAIQWNGEKGHIEYRDNRMPEPIEDESIVLPWIHLYKEEKERQHVDLKKAAFEAEYARLRSPEARKEELANLRWQYQTAGVNVDGITVRTDRETILDVRSIANRDSSMFPVSYKAENGWIVLSSSDMAARLADRLEAHVQSCFDRELALSRKIDSFREEPEKLASLDLNVGWK